MYISLARELVKAKIRNVTDFGATYLDHILNPGERGLYAHTSRRKLTSLDKLIKIELDITSIFLTQKT